MLFDQYSNLLTKKQKEFFEFRFHYDLSLGEIAANLQVSRQAVNDLLRRVTTQLNYYEGRLSLLAKTRIRQDYLAEIEKALTAQDISAVRSWLGKLKQI